MDGPDEEREADDDRTYEVDGSTIIQDASQEPGEQSPDSHEWHRDED